MIRDMFRVPDDAWEKFIRYTRLDDCYKIFIATPQINKVVYDIQNGTTIVYFADNTKEIARVMDGDTFDKETGVLQCVAKKMYGNRSRFLKDVVNKGVVVEKKEKKKK